MDPLHLSEWEKRLRAVEARLAHVTKHDTTLDAWQASLAQALGAAVQEDPEAGRHAALLRQERYQVADLLGDAGGE